MQKLSENFPLTITRGEEFLTWSVEKMLEAFLKELDLREDNFYAVNPSKIGKENRLKGGTATALHVPFVWANMPTSVHENCQRSKDTKERKSILINLLDVLNA